MLEAMLAALMGAAFEFLRAWLSDLRAAQALKDAGALAERATINAQSADAERRAGEVASHAPDVDRFIGELESGDRRF